MGNHKNSIATGNNKFVKKIAIIGSRGYIDKSFNLSSNDLFNKSGGNLGNLAFWYATDLHIKAEKEFFSWHCDPKFISENFDLLVFPAANQIGPHSNMSLLAKLFEKIEIPIVVVGLGSQAPSCSHKIEIPEDTKRWLKIISEKTTTIGIRGSYTASILENLGISNYAIIGCPSLFLSSDIHLGQSIQTKFEQILYKKDLGKVCITAGHPKWHHLRALEHKLFNLFRDNLQDYVCQAHIELVQAARTDHFCDLDEDTKTIIEAFLSHDHHKSRMIDFLKKSVIFPNAEAWMEYMVSFTLSIGTRFHGNMFPLQVGVPAICIPHDSRLEELTTSTLFPVANYKTILKCNNIYEIIELINFDGEIFDQNRKILAAKYWKILDENNILVDPQLLKLVGKC